MKIFHILVYQAWYLFLDSFLFLGICSWTLQKAGKKLHALTRVFKYMDISQWKSIANACMSQFSYCTLNWMFHSWAIDYGINRIHERAPRLTYPNQHQLTFKELLEKNKTVSTRQINLQTFVTEIYKAKNKISPDIVNSLFKFANKNCNLRNVSILKRKR